MHKIGLDDVHVALSSNAISDVKIAWLKFRIDFDLHSMQLLTLQGKDIGHLWYIVLLVQSNVYTYLRVT